MKREYDCLHRLLGECETCIQDNKNYNCVRFYPARRIMDNIITYVPREAHEIRRAIKDGQ